MTEPKLSESDVRAITQLLGEVAILEGDLVAKRRFLAEGLAALISADGWIWGRGAWDPETSNPTVLDVLFGGLDERQVAAWFEACTVALPVNDPITQRLAEGRQLTCTQQELVDDETWQTNPTVRQYVLSNNMAQTLYALTPLGEREWVGIVFYRSEGQEPFSQDERRIAHIVTTEVRWLREDVALGPVSARALQLPQRLRPVLTLLLDGYACDEIADLISLSPHTVKGYMKTIYKHFDVRSHTKLIQAFRHQN